MRNFEDVKILVYADVHGNYDALKKLKSTRDYKTSTKKIFLGDAVTMGDRSKECLEEILNGEEIYILGNHDSYCANGLPKSMHPSKRKLEHQNYIRNQVPVQLREKLKSFLKEYRINLCGKKLYFTHYLWEGDDVKDELKPNERTAENLDKKFEEIDADIIFHGHDHYPFHIKSEKKEYYVVGSLGIKIPAKYIVISCKNGKLKIKHKTLHYNYKKVRDRMIKLDYPRAKEYAEFFTNWKEKILWEKWQIKRNFCLC